MDEDEKSKELNKIRENIKSYNLPEGALKAVNEELERLE